MSNTSRTPGKNKHKSAAEPRRAGRPTALVAPAPAHSRPAPLGLSRSRCRSLKLRRWKAGGTIPPGSRQAEHTRRRPRTPQPPFPRPPGATASPGPRPAAQRWVPPSARRCYERGYAPPLPPPPPLCPAAGMPKLSKEAKQRLQQLFKGGQFAIRWGFIPVVLYLGQCRAGDARGPSAAIAEPGLGRPAPKAALRPPARADAAGSGGAEGRARGPGAAPPRSPRRPRPWPRMCAGEGGVALGRTVRRGGFKL